MLKIICVAVIVGLIVGLGGGLLLATPAVNNLIPDGSEAMIVGAFAGGVAALAAGRVSRNNVPKTKNK